MTGAYAPDQADIPPLNSTGTGHAGAAVPLQAVPPCEATKAHVQASKEPNALPIPFPLTPAHLPSMLHTFMLPSMEPVMMVLL